MSESADQYNPEPVSAGHRLLMAAFAAFGLSGIGASVALLSALLEFLKEYYRA